MREDADKLRLKSVIFDVAGLLLREKFKDEDGNLEIWRYPELVKVTERWFAECLDCKGDFRPQFLKWHSLAIRAVEKIWRAVLPSKGDAAHGHGTVLLPVLNAYPRINQDLRMADKLKATGAGNLFVVFGEPDIVIHKLKDDMLKVEIRGMDIFDPTTGEVRSSGGKELMNDVAAWFIDHDYDEESFFVRQAYFVGNDPYDGLKRALKAEIDETAWAELNSTISRPFPRPEHGRICVKVINHLGDEVQKVFQV